MMTLIGRRAGWQKNPPNLLILLHFHVRAVIIRVPTFSVRQGTTRMTTGNSFADDLSLFSSFDDTMRRLREHDEAASHAVFQRYVKRLLALAQSKLSRQLRQKEDPDDVVQS